MPDTTPMPGIGDVGQQCQQPRRIIAASFGEVSKLAEDSSSRR